MCTQTNSLIVPIAFFCVHRYSLFVLLETVVFSMYTRVRNRMLCTQEYKTYFIVEVEEAFSA